MAPLAASPPAQGQPHHQGTKAHPMPRLRPLARPKKGNPTMNRTTAHKTARRVVYDAPNGPCIIEADGSYTPVASPRYTAATAALAEAWEHRPPAYSRERAIFEKDVMPAARAEVRAAWLATAEQWGIDPDPL